MLTFSVTLNVVLLTLAAVACRYIYLQHIQMVLGFERVKEMQKAYEKLERAYSVVGWELAGTREETATLVKYLSDHVSNVKQRQRELQFLADLVRMVGVVSLKEVLPKHWRDRLTEIYNDLSEKGIDVNGHQVENDKPVENISQVIRLAMFVYSRARIEQEDQEIVAV